MFILHFTLRFILPAVMPTGLVEVSCLTGRFLELCTMENEILPILPGGHKWSEKLKPKLKVGPVGVPRGSTWSQGVSNDSLESPEVPQKNRSLIGQVIRELQ